MPNSTYHPSWKDFAKVFKLIELYVEIESGTCSNKITIALTKQAAHTSHYKDPADYVRYILYPRLMRRINCLGGRHQVGVDSILVYTWDYPDIDQFFHEMVIDKGLRTTYSDIISIMCR